MKPMTATKTTDSMTCRNGCTPGNVTAGCSEHDRQEPPPADGSQPAKPAATMRQAMAPRPVARGAQVPSMAPRTLIGAAQAGANTAWRMLMGGMPGVGKSLFGTNCDAPIFLPFEASSNVPEEMQFPQPDTWTKAREAVHWLLKQPHNYRTLVIDTVDAAHRLCVEHVKGKAQERGESDVRYLGEVGGGYNKGKDATVEEWVSFLALVERLRTDRGMNVLVLGHCEVGKRANPDGADYDQWQLSVDPKVGNLLVGWSEIAAFAFLEVQAGIAGNKKKGRAKGLSTGARKVIFMPRATALWVKNRQGLPAELALDASVFQAALANLKQNRLDPEMVAALVADVERKGKLLAGQTFRDRDANEIAYEEFVRSILDAQPPPTVVKLQQLDSRLTAKLQDLGIDPDADADEEGVA